MSLTPKGMGLPKRRLEIKTYKELPQYKPILPCDYLKICIYPELPCLKL